MHKPHPLHCFFMPCHRAYQKKISTFTWGQRSRASSGMHKPGLMHCIVGIVCSIWVLFVVCGYCLLRYVGIRDSLYITWQCICSEGNNWHAYRTLTCTLSFSVMVLEGNKTRKSKWMYTSYCDILVQISQGHSGERIGHHYRQPLIHPHLLVRSYFKWYEVTVTTEVGLREFSGTF